MACTACTEFGEPNGMFVTGCTSYKVDSLTKHEKPKQHEKCALVTKAKLKSREESSAAKIIQTLNKDIFIKLDKMFITRLNFCVLFIYFLFATHKLR